MNILKHSTFKIIVYHIRILSIYFLIGYQFFTIYLFCSVWYCVRDKLIFIMLLTPSIYIKIYATSTFLQEEIRGSNIDNNTVTMSIEEYDMENKKTSTNIPLEEMKQNLEQLSSVKNPMTINSTKLIENNNRKNHNSVLEVVLDKNNIHIFINNNRHRQRLIYPSKIPQIPTKDNALNCWIK